MERFCCVPLLFQLFEIQILLVSFDCGINSMRIQSQIATLNQRKTSIQSSEHWKRGTALGECAGNEIFLSKRKKKYEKSFACHQRMCASPLVCYHRRCQHFRTITSTRYRSMCVNAVNVRSTCSDEINDKWWDMTTQVRAQWKPWRAQFFFLSPFIPFLAFGCVCVCVCIALLMWDALHSNNIPFSFGERAHSFSYLMPKIAFSQRIFSFVCLCLCHFSHFDV